MFAGRSATWWAGRRSFKAARSSLHIRLHRRRSCRLVLVQSIRPLHLSNHLMQVLDHFLLVLRIHGRGFHSGRSMCPILCGRGEGHFIPQVSASFYHLLAGAAPDVGLFLDVLLFPEERAGAIISSMRGIHKTCLHTVPTLQRRGVNFFSFSSAPIRNVELRHHVGMLFSVVTARTLCASCAFLTAKLLRMPITKAFPALQRTGNHSLEFQAASHKKRFINHRWPNIGHEHTEALVDLSVTTTLLFLKLLSEHLTIATVPPQSCKFSATSRAVKSSSTSYSSTLLMKR